MSSSQLTFIFFRGVAQPPTRITFFGQCLSTQSIHYFDVFFRHNILNQGWCLCGSLHFFEETSMFVWDTEKNGTIDNCKYPNRWVTTCLSAFITVFVAFFATRSPCKRGRSPDDMNLCVPCSLTQDRLGSEVASAPWVSDWIRKPFRLWAGPRGNKSMEFRGCHRENRCFADHPFVVSNQRSKMF